MNSGFHGTFTKAQAEFAKLGGEIAELHKASPRSSVLISAPLSASAVVPSFCFCRVRASGEIAELHKAQSNIAAYQKQQGAIAATEDKLVNLKKQHALLQTEIDETAGSTTSLSREKRRAPPPWTSTPENPRRW